MTASARLVGFCRGMPDVYTFVTPIFVDDAGDYVAQFDQQNSGLVSEFQSVDISDGLERVDFDFAAKVEGPALFAFEVSDSRVALGHPRMLATYLQKNLKHSPRFRESRPQTSAAIDRFLDFALTRPATAGDCYLFELMRITDTYVLRSAELDATRTTHETIPRNLAQWQEEILNSVPADHKVYLDAHQTTEHRIELLALSSKNVVEARTTIEKALSTVLRRSSIVDGQLTYLGKPVCHECLFRLASRYPTRVSLEKLVELEGTTASSWASAVEKEVEIGMDAMEAVHRFLVRRRSFVDAAADVQDNHLQLLTRLTADKRFAGRSKQMMAELGTQRNNTEAEEFLKAMRKENTQFAGTTEFAANFGLRNPAWAQGA